MLEYIGDFFVVATNKARGALQPQDKRQISSTEIKRSALTQVNGTDHLKSFYYKLPKYKIKMLENQPLELMPRYGTGSFKLLH